MRKKPHTWSAWITCPAAETPEEERKRAAEGLRAPPGNHQVKLCSVCGRARVRKVR